MNNRVKIAFLGIAHPHVNTYIECIQRNDNAEIAGVYDVTEQRAAAVSRQYGIPSFANPEDLFAQNPDFCIVGSENVLHHDMIAIAAEHGCDVLCEKPLGVSCEDAAKSVDKCRKCGIRLMTAMCNRYIHSYVDARRRIRNGEIGDLVSVFATNKGTMPGDWFVNPGLSGGGCLIDHVVHVADLMNDLTGEIPCEVYAVSGHNLFDMEVEDSAMVNFRYANGLTVSLDSSWSRMRAYPYGRDLTIQFVGTRGRIFVDYFAESNVLYSNENTKAEYSYYGEDKDQMMIDDIVDCYFTGERSFPISGEDGYNCVIVADAALRSIEQHDIIICGQF